MVSLYSRKHLLATLSLYWFCVNARDTKFNTTLCPFPRILQYLPRKYKIIHKLVELLGKFS